MGLMTGGTDLDLDRRYTLADLESFPEDGRRYELADGWLIVSPMARRLHQLACMRIGEVLDAACPGELFVFGLAINVDDPERTHFEPDVTVVRKQFATVENGDLPLLAVEVRSPSTAGRDAVLKSAAYARLGIPSYWLVDVDVPSVRVLELRRGVYEEVAYAEGDAAIEVERPFPVRLVPRSLVTV
jgi:Uma2 family endonuclease